MNSSQLQDVSLYELALSSEQPPHTLQISPTTFKSMISTVIDVLTNQKISAVLWLKLPKGEVWQAEIERYRMMAGVPHSIYLLQNPKDYAEAEAMAETGGVSQLEGQLDPDAELVGYGVASPGDGNSREQNHQFDDDLISDAGPLLPSIPVQSCFSRLPLGNNSRLRREYFLLVLSPQLCTLVLAHRPRSTRSSSADDEALQDQQLEADEKQSLMTGTDEEIERKHPLLGVCSFEAQTIRGVLEGVNRAICYGQSQLEGNGEPHPEVEDLLVNWDRVVDENFASSLDPMLAGHLFTRQIQRQEEIWHGNAIYRRQAETASELELANAEMINTLRLKDEFLKNVGQELRTPLATMKTALSLIGSPNLKVAQRQRYMDLLSQECDRQSALITSVLDLVQLENAVEQGPMQPLRIADVVPGVVSTYQPLAQEKGITLSYRIPDDLPAVACLNSWMRQIVINLLHNGIKFTPQGGQVRVRAKQQGDYIQLEFRDTGIGIGQSDIPKIFDRFYRVRRFSAEDTGGAGLGLSIVQQLLLRCGGSISVRSQPGEGTIFNVLLPLYH